MKIKKLLFVGVILLGLLLMVSLLQLAIQLWVERDPVVADPEPRPEPQPPAPVPPVPVVVVVDPEPRPEPQPPAPVTVVIVVDPEPRPQQQILIEEPVLKTDNVSRVSSTCVDLAGFIEPRGETVVAWFKYGEEIFLSERTAEFSVKSSRKVLKTVSGLRPGTKYFFRITARNSEGTVFHGKVRSFMTDSP